MQEVEAFAARLAKSMHAKVHVVIVGTRALFGPDAQDEVLFRSAVEDPFGSATAIKARFQALGVEAEVHVQRGQVAEAIRQVERELAPDVLVFGSSNRQKLEFPGYGSVLDQVKNEVPSSILVVRTKELDGVAVGVDGSEASRHAAKVAADWAKALGVPLTLLLGQGVTRPKDLRAESTAQVVGDVGKFFLDWGQEHPRTLVVVGSRGTGNPGLLRMGSVSDRLSWGAHGSVLVVRPEQEPTKTA